MEAGRITRYTKSNALVSKRFRAFFIPALLAAMATQMGVFFDGVIMGQLINSAAMASTSACQPLTQFVSALIVLISTGSVGLIAVRIWTRKESLYKCVGEGMSGFTELPQVLENRVLFRGMPCRFRSWEEEGHAFSIAVRGPDEPIRLAIRTITI